MKLQVLLLATLLLVVPVTSDSNFDDPGVMSAMMWMMNGGSGGGGTSHAKQRTSVAAKKTTSCTDARGRQYRSADGTCNNVNKPTVGSSMDKFKRDVKPQYDDKKGDPRTKGRCLYKTENGCYRPDLPSARAISVVVHSKQKSSSDDDTNTISSIGRSSLTGSSSSTGSSSQSSTGMSSLSNLPALGNLLSLTSAPSMGVAPTRSMASPSMSDLLGLMDTLRKTKPEPKPQPESKPQPELKPQPEPKPALSQGAMSDILGLLGSLVASPTSEATTDAGTPTSVKPDDSDSGTAGMVDESRSSSSRMSTSERQRDSQSGRQIDSQSDRQSIFRGRDDRTDRRGVRGTKSRRDDNDRKGRRRTLGRDNGRRRPGRRTSDRSIGGLRGSMRGRGSSRDRNDNGRRGRNSRRDDRKDDLGSRLFGKKDDRKDDSNRKKLVGRRDDSGNGFDDGRMKPDAGSPDRSMNGPQGMVGKPDKVSPSDRHPATKTPDRSMSGPQGMVGGPGKVSPSDSQPATNTPDRSMSGPQGMVGGPGKVSPSDRQPATNTPDRSMSGPQGLVGQPARFTDRSMSGPQGLVGQPASFTDRSMSGPQEMVGQPARFTDRSMSGPQGMVGGPGKVFPSDRQPVRFTDMSMSGSQGMVEQPARFTDRSMNGRQGMIAEPERYSPSDSQPARFTDRLMSGPQGMVAEPERYSPSDSQPEGNIINRALSAMQSIFGVSDSTRTDRPSDRQFDRSVIEKAMSALKSMFGVSDSRRPDRFSPSDRQADRLVSGLKDQASGESAPDSSVGYSYKRKSKHTDLLRLFTLFIEHEVTATAVEITQKMIDCCDPAKASMDCFPIPIPSNDRRFKEKCMNFIRSRSFNNMIDLKNPREQQNLISAYIDGSAIYGSDLATQTSLRNADGYMLTSAEDLLPLGDERYCQQTYNRYFCFRSGDDRLNLQPGLIIIHTLFVRLHNRIVDSFKGSSMSGEGKFQEARRIVIALVQKFIYEEYLPEILQDKFMVKNGLDKHSYRYDSMTEVRISNVFATAAIKFVSALSPDYIDIRGRKIRLRDTYNNPEMVFDDLPELIEEMLQQPTEERNRFISAELTDHFLEDGSRSFDEVANIIQRGRDHGVPPYNWFRQNCGLPIVRSFSSRVLGDAGTSLRKVYRSVDDIDVFTGGMSEPNLPGSLLGETFSCIFARQFRDLKYGDSFFYLSNDPQRGFTKDQRRELDSITLSNAMCFVFELEAVQMNPFKVPSPQNPLMDCETVPSFFSFLEDPSEGPRSNLLSTVSDKESVGSGSSIMSRFFDSETSGQSVKESGFASVSNILPRVFRPDGSSNAVADASQGDSLSDRSERFHDIEEVEEPEEFGTRGEPMSGRVSGMSGKVSGMSGRVSSMSGRVSSMSGRVPGMSGRVSSMSSVDGVSHSVSMGVADSTMVGPQEGQASNILPKVFTDGRERSSGSSASGVQETVIGQEGSDPTLLPGVPLDLQPRAQDPTKLQGVPEYLQPKPISTGSSAVKAATGSDIGEEGVELEDQIGSPNVAEGAGKVQGGVVDGNGSGASGGLGGSGGSGGNIESEGSSGSGGFGGSKGESESARVSEKSGDDLDDCCQDDSKCSDDDKNKDCKKSDTK